MNISMNFAKTRKIRLTTPFTLAVTLALASVGEVKADCCGGGGASTGMPPIEKFAHVQRLRLKVFPGVRKQNLEFHDLKTGDLLHYVAIGAGTDHPSGFSISMPIGPRAAIGYTVANQTGSNLSEPSASASETPEDPTTNGEDDDCCDPASRTTTGGGAEEGEDPGTTAQPGSATTCEEAGEGSANNTSNGAPDDPGQGGGTTPINPPSPSISQPPADGGGTRAPAC